MGELGVANLADWIAYSGNCPAKSEADYKRYRRKAARFNAMGGNSTYEVVIRGTRADARHQA